MNFFTFKFGLAPHIRLNNLLRPIFHNPVAIFPNSQEAWQGTASGARLPRREDGHDRVSLCDPTRLKRQRK
jgi:hypothetical protein